MQELPSRPRRNRRSPTIRGAVQENHLTVNNFILPLFVHEGDENQPIPSMPGVNRLSFNNGLIDFVSEARSYGVNQVVVFPKVRFSLRPFLWYLSQPLCGSMFKIFECESWLGC